VSFARLWESLLPIGRDGGTGGYRRFSWTGADAGCRDWFFNQAAKRRMPATADANGNLWAWWAPSRATPAPATSGDPAQAGGEPGIRDPAPPGRAGPDLAYPGAEPWAAGSARRGSAERPLAGCQDVIVAGSHLDSVPDGGAFDGPLGVVSAFAAIDLLRERGIEPARPLAVAAFTEEEGARFGIACLGSRLLVGAIDPESSRALQDAAGTTLAQAMTAAGYDPAGLGADEELLSRVAAYVELHIEQGRALADLDAPVAVADRIWPHSRWRLAFTGQPDHAGTAALADRHDPMLPFATAVLAARQAAAEHGARATVGKVIAEPGAVNAVASSVSTWLDARAPDEPALRATVGDVVAAAQEAGAAHSVRIDARQESVTPAVEFDPALRGTLVSSLAARGIAAPVLATQAGHDAGILAAKVPTAMLFVRNPSGISHSPAEHADLADCEAGVQALASVLEDLAQAPTERERER
jgi:beta-ureidopropionase / N-carbamoyl-L-amino-acid hydrolase